MKSTSYEWLVVAGHKAVFKGNATVNGEEGYGFILFAIDGTPDMFRIKIYKDGVGTIYDNQWGASDADDPVTALGGGSIIIHK